MPFILFNSVPEGTDRSVYVSIDFLNDCLMGLEKVTMEVWEGSGYAVLDSERVGNG